MKTHEYALYRGVSRGLISRYLNQGRLKGAAKKKNGRWDIDSKKADPLMDSQRDPAQPVRKPSRSGKKKKPSSKKKTSRKKSPTQAEKENIIQEGGTDKLDFAEARTLNEQYKAALKKLEFDQKVGRLVYAEEVERAAFDTARQVRDALENIPDQVGPGLINEPDAEKIIQAMRTAIREALEELSKG